jgi:hypothetical protein
MRRGVRDAEAFVGLGEHVTGPGSWHDFTRSFTIILCVELDSHVI